MVAKSLRLAAVPVLTGLMLGGGVVLYRMNYRTTTPTPAGAVRGDATGALVISTDRLDFGSVDSSDRSVMRQILLRNSASKAMNISVSDPGDGFGISPRTLTLDPGAIGRVVVTAAPRSGPIRGELRLTTDEDPARPYLVALEGGSRADRATGAAVAKPGDDPSCAGGNCDTGDRVAALAPGSIVLSRPSSYPDQTLSPVAASTPAGGGPQPGVTFTRTNGAPQAADPGSPATHPASSAPLNVAVAPPRSIAERPAATPADDSADGETPQPIRRPHRDDPRTGNNEEEGTTKPAGQGVSMLAVAPGSTLTLMGTTNQFYPQQLGILGTSAGGPFSIASSLQVPRIPLAFGQLMEFSQNGSAVGSFDAGSGQVNINLPLQAVDSTGRAAPVVLSLTTGTVVIRNSNGVLVSATGTPRSASGSLRLVGIGKIPSGYRNGAEEQLVTVEILGSLSLSDPTEAHSAPTGAGSEL